MTKKEIKKILSDDAKYQMGQGGKRADFRGADLCGADLKWVDLRAADFGNAYLERADLRWANLRYANFENAHLEKANLRGADLTGANLFRAHLAQSNLLDADFSGANLSEAYLIGVRHIPFIPQLEICPSHGDFIGWKKLKNGAVAELLIPADAERLSGTTRKCRCSYARILAIYDGKDQEIDHGYSPRGMLYAPGMEIRPDSFDECRWRECSNGIYFFITREEAEDYEL